ncbi:hypothetical protein NL676_011348 [Syzygium grande]|nr:hypothetical protein NL676_011348 [Syzygium grande]
MTLKYPLASGQELSHLWGGAGARMVLARSVPIKQERTSNTCKMAVSGKALDDVDRLRNYSLRGSLGMWTKPSVLGSASSRPRRRMLLDRMRAARAPFR